MGVLSVMSSMTLRELSALDLWLEMKMATRVKKERTAKIDSFATRGSASKCVSLLWPLPREETEQD